MDATPVSQQAIWNGNAGNSWVDLREMLDGMFHPFETMLAQEIEAGQRVLDVGCGTGSTTLAAVRRGAICAGVDLSGQMIDVARESAHDLGLDATFIHADAQQYPFPAANFETVISRFGIMFFDDPVAAFANLWAATQPGGRLHAFVWRGAEENPYMTAVERATAPLLPQLPPRRPNAPGQFAFARPERVRDILARSGWGSVRIEAVDVPCAYPSAQAQRYVARLGPLGQVLPTLDERARHHLISVAKDAIVPYIEGDSVRFTAACWQVRAQA